MNRRFSIIDAMILVGATALGLSVVRSWAGPVYFTPGTSFSGKLTASMVVLTSVCLYWSIAILVISLRHPRAPLKLLCRQPGQAACLAVVLASLFILINNLPVVLHFRRSTRFFSSATDLLLAASTTTHQLAASIVVAWTVLVLSGNWSAVSGWIDRLGRTVGTTILGLYTVQLFYQYYSVLF
jgi:hypothetical protein